VIEPFTGRAIRARNWMVVEGSVKSGRVFELIVAVGFESIGGLSNVGSPGSVKLNVAAALR
jgi:hypothetical protein